MFKLQTFFYPISSVNDSMTHKILRTIFHDLLL